MKILRLLVYIWLVLISIAMGVVLAGWLSPEPSVGMGIYFEDGRLIVDGGRQQGFVFTTDCPQVDIPEWMKTVLDVNECWNGSVMRNFHFDCTSEEPNEPNNLIIDSNYARKALSEIDEKYSQIKYSQFTGKCPCCANVITAPHIGPYYWFVCSECCAVLTNTDCETVQDFYDLVGFQE